MPGASANQAYRGHIWNAQRLLLLSVHRCGLGGQVREVLSRTMVTMELLLREPEGLHGIGEVLIPLQEKCRPGIQGI
jgi:hypothetical protein